MNGRTGYIILNRKSAKKLIALGICTAFILGAFFSSVFIFWHADHEHDHDGHDDGCAICAQLAAADNLLKSMPAAIGAAFAFVYLCAVFSVLELADSGMRLSTLVRLKVRLNT